MSKYQSKKVEELLKSTKDDTVKSILFNLRLIPTFSLVIDATFEPINTFLVGGNPELTQDQITSLIVAGTCQFIFKSYDRFKGGQELKKYLESQNIQNKVSETTNKITKLLKIGSGVLKDMGYTAGTVSGILGFASILHPLMTGINELMGRNTDFNIDNIFNYLIMGATFKGALFLEQFITKFTKSFEKEADITLDYEEENDFPESFEYGEKFYEFIRKNKKGVYLYHATDNKDDKLAFGSKREFEEFVGDYTSPIGGTQSTYLGETFLTGNEILSLIDKTIKV